MLKYLQLLFSWRYFFYGGISHLKYDTSTKFNLMYQQYQALKKRQKNNYRKDLKLTGRINQTSFQQQLNTYTLVASLFSFIITIFSLLMVHQRIDYVIGTTLIIWWFLNLTLKAKMTSHLLLIFSIWSVNIYQFIALYCFHQNYGLSLIVVSFSICTIILSKALQIMLQRRFNNVFKNRWLVQQFPLWFQHWRKISS